MSGEPLGMLPIHRQETNIPDPAPFLLARIEEDLALVERTFAWLETLGPPADPTPRSAAGVASTVGDGDRLVWVPMVHREGEDFTARWDPKRAEHEANARWNLVHGHAVTEGNVCKTCVTEVDGRPVPIPYPCPTLVQATWGYYDHPDYAPAWEATGGCDE